MFKVYMTINSKARTLKGINAAISKSTGEPDVWFQSQRDLDASIREGFIEFTSNKIVLYYDGI